MPRSSSNSKKYLAGLIVAAAVIALCVRFVDVPVAQVVKGMLFANRNWGFAASRMPDLLLHLVVISTLGALSLRYLRIRRGKDDAFNRFLLLICWDAPASYVLKGILKPLFGRLNNRLWLKNPDLYGFYWFDIRRGFDGFPSGHMLVLVTLLALLVRFYPRFLIASVLLALAAAVALVVTGFHFVSDIIAGAYVGILLEAAVHAAVSRRHPSFGAFGLFPNSR